MATRPAAAALSIFLQQYHLYSGRCAKTKTLQRSVVRKLPFDSKNRPRPLYEVVHRDKFWAVIKAVIELDNFGWGRKLP
jgi:hypothetical protein